MQYDKPHILNVDRQHTWHPFTQMKDYEKLDPVVITRGEGLYIYDSEGNKYYDTISSWWVNILGHCNPRINAAVKKQLDTLEHVNFSGFTHPYATEVVELLREMIHEDYTRVFFSDNGSTAIEVAIKMAFQYFLNKGQEKKRKFAMLNNSYHGDTLGATSVGAVDIFHKIYKPLMFDSIRVAAPYDIPRKGKFTYDAEQEPYNPECFEPMRKAIEENADELAAVIVEPLLQGAGGIKIYHSQYLIDLQKCARENEVLVICDEVATGFGRTGTLYAFEQAEGFVPDIFATAKGLTGGYMPMALTVTTEKIFEAFYGDFMDTFFHGHSYTANPLACSAAIETMKILKEENLPYSKGDVMAHFHARLREWEQFDFVGDIRYRGFFGAIDMVKSRKEETSFPAEERIGFQIYTESRNHGVILRPMGDVIYWCLPLTVTKEDIDDILARSLAAIQAVIATN